MKEIRVELVATFENDVISSNVVADALRHLVCERWFVDGQFESGHEVSIAVPIREQLNVDAVAPTIYDIPRLQHRVRMRLSYGVSCDEPARIPPDPHLFYQGDQWTDADMAHLQRSQGYARESYTAINRMRTEWGIVPEDDVAARSVAPEYAVRVIDGRTYADIGSVSAAAADLAAETLAAAPPERPVEAPPMPTEGDTA